MREAFKKIGKWMLRLSVILPLFGALMWLGYHQGVGGVLLSPDVVNILIICLGVEIFLLIFGLFFYGYKSQAEVSREKAEIYVYGVPDQFHSRIFTLEMRKDYWSLVLKNLFVSVVIAFVYLLLSAKNNGTLFGSKLITALVVVAVMVGFSLVAEVVEYFTDISKLDFSSRQIAIYRKGLSRSKIINFSGDDTVSLMFAKGENSFLELQLGKKRMTLRLDNKKLAHDFWALKGWLDENYEQVKEA